ncbi:thiopeptide-type bacteriocin biosynthesis protein [Mucilaginibacter sp. SP1R1]|uniref:thiopeptide-type bacteriocin biosynthesis protein n=1 Tax=Mucilaginibacter sp. SP1R1 TaxID=2723091 RepID=UPI00161B18EA|nr:thiopeptide-type bacteriocin biosynthesis protein [Mucilaginibacter sp. SP1R1]MBB6152399.1 thiopeptide-type bacteriocin biosynthesis protein [Mucilaginibacter sp. SP1R1]
MDVKYEFLPRLFLRSPLYSFARYDLDRLPEVLEKQVFRNALWLASPDLYRQLSARGFDFQKLTEKQQHTLYKYYNRMCFRPTPFGSFASFTSLEWSDTGTLYLQPDDQASLHLEPDQALLSYLWSTKGAQSMDRLVSLNPTLYRLEREFRFIRSVPDARGKYHFTIEALEAEVFYIRLIARLRKNNLPVTELRQWVRSHLSCTENEAMVYIHFLLEAQVLLGPETGQIIGLGSVAMRSVFPGWVPGQKMFGTVLLSAAGPLEAWTAPVSNQSQEKQAPQQCFYAALERPLQSGGADRADQRELQKAIRILQQLALPADLADLQRFIRAFKAKFDLEKVPLLLALDPDAGISYANLGGGPSSAEALPEIRFPDPVAANNMAEWTEAHQVLFRLWRDTARDDHAPLQLNEQDILPLPASRHPRRWPVTMAVMYRRTEDHLLLEQAGGVTAAALIGRFSVFSEQVGELARSLAAEEQRYHPGLIFADIAQLNDLHVDNINRRQKIYPYTIPVNVYTETNDPAVIRPDDLYVSVVDDELILESKRLGKRVMPRLATAYNFHHNELAVFRLLGDLQYQGLHTGLFMDLERFFPGMDFYPRVVAEGVILACAKWKLDETVLKALSDEREDDAWTKVRNFRIQHHLPQRLSMGTGDQQLVFDLGDRREAAFFLQCIEPLKTATLQEYLLPDRSVKNGNKPLAGQFIAFLKHGEKIYDDLPARNRVSYAGVTREFLPGSNWLYLKIYCTTESANLILLLILKPSLEKNASAVREWFFIRYYDQAHHLRIRINVRDGLAGRLLVAVKAHVDSAPNGKMVRVFQADTYRRELERYGPDLIELAEHHFYRSSELLLQCIDEEAQETANLTEFQVAFLSAYHLLMAFQEDLPGAKRFTGLMVDAFQAEFGGTKELKIGMDAKYRVLKPGLTAIFQLQGEGSGLIKIGGDLLTKLIAWTEHIAAAAGHKTADEKTRLAGDLIHMHLNRAFRDNQRQQEFLVYYCLHKYITGRLARE